MRRAREKEHREPALPFFHRSKVKTDSSIRASSSSNGDYQEVRARACTLSRGKRNLTASSTTAAVRPLDEVFPNGLAPARLVKVDVQGMECSVLTGGLVEAERVGNNAQVVAGVGC